MARKRTNLGTVHEPVEPYGGRTAEVVQMPAALLEVGELYMEQLKENARIVSQSLSKAGVGHAIVGGLAVAAHVALRKPGAERNTRDLDLLLDPVDLDRAATALKPQGFRLRKVTGIFIFCRHGEKFRQAVHIVRAGEKVRSDYLHAAPTVPVQTNTLKTGDVHYIGLLDLLAMKLTSFRLKDQVHVQDLLLAGLVTKKIERALPKDLQARLRQVKETTERERLG